MKESWIDTPLGPMLAIAGDRALHLLDWDEGGRLAMGRNRLAALGEIGPGETVLHHRLRDQLAAYFAGTRATFDLALSQPGPAFRQSVWQALQTIPAGRTETYSGLARHLGRPDAPRAVGAANGANLISILVPCHRLVGAGGQLTGYGGGIPRKDWLLRHEAAAFGPGTPPHSR